MQCVEFTRIACVSHRCATQISVMMLIIISLQVNHLSLLFLVERAANHYGSRCLQNDGHFNHCRHRQVRHAAVRGLCTLTSTPKGCFFAACLEDGCTATDLRRQVEFNGSKGSALQNRVQMPTKKEIFGFRDTGPMSQSLLTKLCLTTGPEDKSDPTFSVPDMYVVI